MAEKAIQKEEKPRQNPMEKKREHMLELRMIDHEIKEMQQQMEAFESQNNEIVAVQQAIDEIKSQEKGREILVPIAGGIFLKAELGDTSRLLLNIGASTVVEKTPDEAKALLDQQRNEIAEVETHLTQKLHELIERAIMLQAVLKEE